MIEFSNLFRRGAIRVIPNIIINGTISIETVLHFDRFAMISDILWPLRCRPPSLLLRTLRRSGTNMPFSIYIAKNFQEITYFLSSWNADPFSNI